MKDESSVDSSNTVLQILRNNGKILYPELIAQPARTLAEVSAGNAVPLDGPPLAWSDFPLLPPMRGSLNFIWGRLILQEHVLKKNIAFYGCSKLVGTTFLSFHLALFAALGQGLKTIYIDTDCDKGPDDGHPVGNTELPGLRSAFFEDIPVEDCIYQTRIPNFFILPSGRPIPDSQANQFPPTETIKALAGRIHDQFDVVIYDCQSVLLKPIEIAYAQQADNIILVSRYAVSRREVCNQVIEAFKDSNLTISGVVLNQREYPIPKSIYDMLK
jgi:Mrp family chromosome partitioning ATPase